MAKETLAKKTLLSYPSGRGELRLKTDASNVAVGGVLEEKLEGQIKPIAFFSKKLNPSEKNMSTFTRELLAVFLSIRKFEHYLKGVIQSI